MTKATISTKGQIAIPKAVRERLKLRAGTQVSIDVHGEALVMKRLVPDYPDWRSMRGLAKGGESVAQGGESVAQGGESLTKALTEERAAELAHDHARTNQGR
jgi:AbrB family looped-hinge helix DNA binding protein